MGFSSSATQCSPSSDCRRLTHMVRLDRAAVISNRALAQRIGGEKPSLRSLLPPSPAASYHHV